MRPGEAFGLRWEDINPEKVQLLIIGTLKQERGISPSRQRILSVPLGILYLGREDQVISPLACLAPTAQPRTVELEENLLEGSHLEKRERKRNEQSCRKFGGRELA